MSPPRDTAPGPGSIRTILATAGIIAAILVLLIAVWAAAQVLLMLFGALLFAILLRSFAEGLSRHTPLSINWSLAVVATTLVLLIGLGAVLAAPTLAEQVEEFVTQLPEAGRQIEQLLHRYGWGERLISGIERWIENFEDPDEMGEYVGLAFSWILTGISSLLIIFFVGVYFSISPGMYEYALVRVVPLRHRPRAKEVLDTVGHTLQWWLITRLVSMTAVGLLTMVTMLLLGVPLAPLLGLQAFALTFVPYIGPIAATIPIAIVALIESPMTLLWAVVLYTVIQSFEGFVIMPLAQERIVHLPPAATLISEVLMGVWFGVLGVVFATPLAAALLPVIKMVYLEDTLGEKRKDAKEK